MSLEEVCAGKKVVIFGVPGAFTPGCSKTHLPGRVLASSTSSVSDPDSVRSVDPESGSGSRRPKFTHINRKFHVLKFFFEG